MGIDNKKDVDKELGNDLYLFKDEKVGIIHVKNNIEHNVEGIVFNVVDNKIL